MQNALSTQHILYKRTESPSIAFREHYTRPISTNQMYDCAWERLHSKLHCGPSIAVNQRILYKPTLNYIHYSSEPFHMETSGRHSNRVKVFASDRFPYSTASSEQLLFLSSPAPVQPACYYTQALLNIATPVAVLTTHNAYVLSNAVNTTIWKTTRSKPLGWKVFAKHSGEMFCHRFPFVKKGLRWKGNSLVSLPTALQPVCCYIQDILSTATPVAVLATHHVIKSSTTVSITIWRSLRRTQFSPNVSLGSNAIW